MTDTSEAVADAAFDPRAVLQLLRERKWSILGTASIITALAVVWTLRQPKIYEAVCTIQYDPTPARPLGSAVEDVSAPAINFWMTREWYETQNALLKSRTVAERVVRNLELNSSADFFYVPEADRTEWQSPSVEETALVLIERLSVQQSKDTRIVEIRIRDRDPERAKLLTNGVAHAYIEHTQRQRVRATEQAVTFLADRLDQLTRELRGSEEALHQFREDNNVLSVALEDRQNVIARDLERYSAALADANTQRIAVVAKLQALRAANNTDPMQVDAKLVSQNATVVSLRTTYREAAADLAAGSLRYGENHPIVRQLQTRIDTIREQLRHEIDSIISSVASELREMRANVSGLREALSDVHAAGLVLNQQEIRYNELRRRRVNTEKLYDMVLERTSETDLTKMQKISTVNMVDSALTPERPVSPRVGLNIIGGAVLGLIFGLVFALLGARMDRTLKTVADAEALGLCVLGLLPVITGNKKEQVPGRRGRRGRRGKRLAAPKGFPSRDLIVHNDPMSQAAESVRTIRTNLTFMAAEHSLRSLVLTSPSPLEGKTTVAISLATVLAQGGKRVVLVDTDLRRPRLHRAFELKSTVGVTSVLVAQDTLDDALQETRVPNLTLLASGPIPPNPSELLHTAAFADLLRSLKQRFDHVLFDSPPIGAVTDSAILAPQVDGVVLVLKSERTTRDAALSALKQLRAVGGNVLGCVLNDVDVAKQEAYYGGQYYYSASYYGTEPEGKGGPSDSDAAEAAE